MVDQLHLLQIAVATESTNSPGTLPESTRTVALMAILGIALLGLLMIVATMLGAQWIRRLGTHRRGPAVPPDVHLPKPTQRPRRNRPLHEVGEGDTIGTDETTIS